MLDGARFALGEVPRIPSPTILTSRTAVTANGYSSSLAV